MKESVKTVLGITGIVLAACVLALTVLYGASRINSRNNEEWKVVPAKEVWKYSPKADGDIYASEDSQKFITVYQDGLVYNYDGHAKTIRTGKIKWSEEGNNKKSVPNKQSNPQPIKSDAISSEQTFTIGFEENLTAAIANDRMISFGETDDGKLDIKLSGYTGATEATEDLIRLLKEEYGRYKCERVKP